MVTWTGLIGWYECDVGELWVDEFNNQQLILDNNGTHICADLRWFKDGGKADANIADEGQDAKAHIQGEQVEGMVISTTNIR